MTRRDPHDPLGWEWRAEYREADDDRRYLGEWQINGYPGGGNSPCWLASGGTGEWAEDARVAHLMAAAPDLYRALLYAKTHLLVSGLWTPAIERDINAALCKARGPADDQSQPLGASGLVDAPQRAR